MMNYNEQKTIIDLSDAVNISDLGIKITNILESSGTSQKNIHLNLGNIDLKQSQLLSIKALIEAMQSKLVGIETSSDMTEASAVGLGVAVGKIDKKLSSTIDATLKVELEKPVEISRPQEIEKPEKTEELSSFAQLKQMNSVGDFVSNTETLQEVQAENLQEETNEFLKQAALEEDEADTETENNAEPQNIYDAMSKETLTPEGIESALDITFGSQQPEEESTDDIFAPITMQTKFEDYEITETTERADDGKYVLLDTEGITPEGLELIKSNTSDLQTLYLTQTLRSGQTVSFEGNIFLIGDAHPGSEINATGDITIWGILGGIVHAGSKGNTDAKVRALKLNPIQLRIANLYSRRNDTVNVPYVQKSNEFTPEEARIENNQIVIYKTLRRED